ncbi:hypothetical protein [Fodinicola feengrottensis]|uniref:hypothetical protein n=1 Tax=Fodinicola feengrottensis TaxID=435914 RepID=UPI0013D3AE4F|nr:hypothetical protein [Fodinicola feengrottensis]
MTAQGVLAAGSVAGSAEGGEGVGERAELFGRVGAAGDGGQRGPLGGQRRVVRSGQRLVRLGGVAEAAGGAAYVAGEKAQDAAAMQRSGLGEGSVAAGDARSYASRRACAVAISPLRAYASVAAGSSSAAHAQTPFALASARLRLAAWAAETTSSRDR